MTDPLNPTDAASDASAFAQANAFAQDGGLNSSDSADWENQKSALRWPMIVLFGLPMVILALGLALVFVSYNMVHKPAAKPEAAISAQATASTSAIPVDKDAEIAQLQAQIATLQSHPSGEGAPLAPSQSFADQSALTQLSARMDRLEANQRALVHAASSAYAARALQIAASGSQPFISELAVVEPTLDDPALVAALKPFAEKGVPTVVSLAIEFPRVAAKANIAATNLNSDKSLLSNIKNALGKMVDISIRRTDNYLGEGAQANILHAEMQVNQGDLKGAVANLSALKPEVQKAIKPWLDQAKARVLIDDTTRRISESALNRLSQMNTNPAYGQNNGGAL